MQHERREIQNKQYAKVEESYKNTNYLRSKNPKMYIQYTLYIFPESKCKMQIFPVNYVKVFFQLQSMQIKVSSG